MPSKPRRGIVVNLPEMRLFYFPKNRVGEGYTYPIGIGREGWLTPRGKMKVLRKRYHPVWNIPRSVKRAYDEDGISLPRIIRSGPNNPLGKYAIHLSRRGILLHGTNYPQGVGQRSTSGCMSLYPKDIKQLYRKIKVGEELRVDNNAYRVVKDKYGDIWLTIFSQLNVNEERDFTAKRPQFKLRVITHSFDKIVDLLLRYDAKYINWPILSEMVAQPSGIPLLVASSGRK